MPVRLGLPLALAVAAGTFGALGIFAQIQDLNPSHASLVVQTPPVDTVVPSSTLTVVAPAPEVVIHIPAPQEVRGIYWTAETARIPKAEELLSYMKKSGLNTAVIDLKMDNGEVALPPKSLLDKLAVEKIYRIARLPVMKDSAYGKAHPEDAIKNKNGSSWHDKIGSIWLDPSKTAVSDNAIALAQQAYQLGFDEIQFDYVRFASDGALSSIAKTEAEKTQTKQQIMRGFYDRVGGALLKDGIPISFDLFGVAFLSNNEVGIGQHLEDVYPNATYVSPMAYPSHYWPGYLGFKNPSVHPYEVVKDTLDKGAEILQTDHFISATSSRSHFRPWIQDFDLGATYTASMIEAEIKASRDAGASGFLIWNARNVYEPADYLKR